MAQSFDPYYKWLGIPPTEQPPNHYRLLGLNLYETDPDVIDTAANRQMSYLHQCATGPHAGLSQKLLNEVSIARVTLLNPKKKSAYDQKLRSELSQDDYVMGVAVEEPDPLLSQLPSGIPSTARALRASRKRNSSMIGLGIFLFLVASAAGFYIVLGGGDETSNTPSDDDSRVTAKKNGQSTGSSKKQQTEPVSNPTPQPTPETENPKPPLPNPNPEVVGTNPPLQPNPESEPPKTSNGRVNTIGVRLTYIESGTFPMGSPPAQAKDDDEFPKHSVTISKGFLISSHEITQGQYESIMRKNPSFNRDRNNPVENVSWEEAVEFCERLSEKEGAIYRLPTEAEWEYVARAGTTTDWFFGKSDDDLSDYAWWDENSQGETHNVGLLKPNPFGVYDIYGNVAEWCQDWYASNYYQITPDTDPQGPTLEQLDGVHQERVVRGGTFNDQAIPCRSAYRYPSAPDTRNPAIGFRIVQELPASAQNPETPEPPMIGETPETPISPMDPDVAIWQQVRDLIAARKYTEAETLLQEALESPTLDEETRSVLDR